MLDNLAALRNLAAVLNINILRWGSKCVKPVLVRTLKLSTLSSDQKVDWCPHW